MSAADAGQLATLTVIVTALVAVAVRHIKEGRMDRQEYRAQVVKEMAEMAKLHTQIAEDVWPNGATLRCSCGYEVKVTAKDCAHYLKRGWPRHCFRQMEVIS